MNTTSYNYSAVLDPAHNAGISIVNAFINGVNQNVSKVLCSTPIIEVTSGPNGIRVIVQLFYFSTARSVFTNAAVNALANVLSLPRPSGRGTISRSYIRTSIYTIATTIS